MEAQTITAFLAIGSIIFIGFFGSLIFTRYRIPDVLILVALGMIIGPEVLGTMSHLVTYGTLSEIEQYRDLFLSAALVLILFNGGLNLGLRAVIQSMRLATLTTILTLILEILLVATALHFIMGVDFLLALVVGSIIGGTGEAVVIPIVKKMRIGERTKAMLIMESVVTDVIVIVVAITLMSLIAIGDFSLMAIARQLAVKFVVGGLVGFTAGIAWLFVLQRLQNQPLSYMITVGALFVVAGFVEMSPIGSSSAVAALAFGLAIGNRRFVKRWLTSVTLRLSSDEHIHDFHSEISFFVRTFFYVYLGLLFRFKTFEPIHLAIGIGIIAIIVIVRRVTSLMAYRVGDLEKSDADALFAMMPRGLAAAVLATMPATLLAGTSVWSPEYDQLFLNVILIVILGTTMLATILSFWTEKTIDKRNRHRLRTRLAEES
ncbi:MAG: cation:proton antiporter [Thermoplasmatota archaeon]|nr:cation:proton antiporter [Candidatus Thermoplasmatota archaeon]